MRFFFCQNESFHFDVDDPVAWGHVQDSLHDSLEASKLEGCCRDALACCDEMLSAPRSKRRKGGRGGRRERRGKGERKKREVGEGKGKRKKERRGRRGEKGRRVEAGMKVGVGMGMEV